MTLELKHIAPYLPYGVMLGSPAYRNGRISKIRLEGRHLGKNGLEDLRFYKPILRPLSDITGEDLISLFDIAYKQVYGDIDKDLDNFHFHGWDGELNFGLTVMDEMFEYGFSMDFEDSKDFRLSYRNKDSLCENSTMKIDKLELFSKLFEMNFDIFGLIDQGLAIDINTLNEKES